MFNFSYVRLYFVVDSQATKYTTIVPHLSVINLTNNYYYC